MEVGHVQAPGGTMTLGDVKKPSPEKGLLKVAMCSIYLRPTARGQGREKYQKAAKKTEAKPDRRADATGPFEEKRLQLEARVRPRRRRLR